MPTYATSHQTCRLQKIRSQFIRFAIAGTVGFVVDAGVLCLLLWLGLGYFSGRALSFITAVWSTWRINRRFAFAAVAGQPTWREGWRYLIAMSGGGAVNYAAYSLVVLVFRDASSLLPIYAVAVGAVAGMLLNFIMAKCWVFKQGDYDQSTGRQNG